MKKIEKDIVISELLYQSFYGKLSEDEQTMLDCWLKEEANRELYTSLKNSDVLYDGVQEIAELDTAHYYQKLQHRINRQRRMRLWLTATGVAAVVIPLTGLLFLFPESPVRISSPFILTQEVSGDQTTLQTVEGKTYYFDDSVKQLQAEEIEEVEMSKRAYPQETKEETKMPEYNVLATSSRGTIEVTLSDSSRVWLNAGSRLRYPNEFQGDRREVELSGEAYFQVAHNEQQPFIVKTSVAQVKVVGTQFDVNCKDGRNCITTLVEGSVKVHNMANDSVLIQPGQQIQTSATGTMSIQSVDPRYYTAWKRNRFAFQDKALWQIMEELSAWYGVTFEFVDWKAANQRFTTIVPRYPEIKEVLEILQATQSFSFVESANGHISITGYTYN